MHRSCRERWMSNGKLTAQRPVALLYSLKTWVERHITYHACTAKNLKG